MKIMGDLFKFEHHDYLIRKTELDGEIRLSATDCCAALGYSDPATNWTLLKKRNPELVEVSVPIKLIATDGKRYETDTLALDGVAMLCMLAKTERARSFRMWAKDVLAKAIEQQHAPSANLYDSWPQLPRTMGEALRLAADQLERADRLAIEVASTTVKLEQAQPKVEVYDKIMAAEGGVSVATAARQLGMGQHRLFNLLRDKGILRKDDPRLPLQKHVNAGLFLVKASTWTNPKTEQQVFSSTMLVTAKGVDWIYRTLMQSPNPKQQKSLLVEVTR